MRRSPLTPPPHHAAMNPAAAGEAALPAIAAALSDITTPEQLRHDLRDGRAPMMAALRAGRADDVRRLMALIDQGVEQHRLTPRDPARILTATNRFGQTPLHLASSPELAAKLTACFEGVRRLVQRGALPEFMAYVLLAERDPAGLSAVQRLLMDSEEEDAAPMLVALLADLVRHKDFNPLSAKALLLDWDADPGATLARHLNQCPPSRCHRPFDLRLEALRRGLITPREAMKDLLGLSVADGPDGRQRDALRALFRSDRAALIARHLMRCLLALHRHQPLDSASVHRLLHRRPDHGGPLVQDLRTSRSALAAYAEGVIALARAPGFSVGQMQAITDISDLSDVARVLADHPPEMHRPAALRAGPWGLAVQPDVRPPRLRGAAAIPMDDTDDSGVDDLSDAEPGRGVDTSDASEDSDNGRAARPRARARHHPARR